MIANLIQKIPNTIQILFSIVFISGFTSCKHDKLKVDTSSVELSLKTERFDRDFFSTDSANFDTQLTALKKKYPVFLPSYYSEILRLGNYYDTGTNQQLKQFRFYPALKKLYEITAQKFPDCREYDAQFAEAFRHFKYYFPADTLPEIIYYISEFNIRNAYYGSILGVSLDFYLGSDFMYYPGIGFSDYQVKRMRPEYIVTDALYAFSKYKYENTMKSKRFIDRMIFEGKLLYFITALAPEMPDTLKLGYTTKQLEWCEKSEWQIWQQMVDPKIKLLYNSEKEEIDRYFNDGPFTNAYNVPPESAPRFAAWTGWQIVKKYMDENPDVTLPQLMADTESDKILTKSKYKP